MFKILVSDKLEKEGLDILTADKRFVVECKFGVPADELQKVIKDYDALIVRSGTQVTAKILEAAGRLKVIGRAGVGLDNVDLPAATQKGVVAMNTPAGNTTSTAEHTMSLIMALSRNIPQAVASLKGGKWERSKFTGVELYGKVLGIIGLGRIGSTVAKMAQAFGMVTVGYDPYLSAEIAAKNGIKLLELKDIYKTADYITVHIPKTEETTHMIGEAQIALMKKTARLINAARGGIIDEAALIKALQEKRIAGAALDVYEVEPPDFNSPLFKLDNCITTPHLGASTSEAQLNVAIEIAHAVKDALTGAGIRNAANFPSLSPESYKVIEPYLGLAQRMGKFAGQLVQGRISRVTITYSGALAQEKVTAVTMALAHGLLSPVLGEGVNTINALNVMKERGINIKEIVSNQEGEYVNAIALDIATDKEPFFLLGTLSGNKQPRIVKINNVYVETVPQGHMLFINNNDKPGIVGTIGTLLASENINIAGITLGREDQQGVAVSVVNVDSEIPESLIEKLRHTQNILFVKAIKV
ncbi:MAG: phosphoglycerate dehydrogenase [Candidatus Omnitrophica bacterium]|nr:phosphoglycerate dehydrogenase [Candidatus Omnitrophota bacterium]MDE2009965.1 phosphoglycerate dehydrogenase [Candidatus Omnitrophota bacterium]MDE2213943.1 phosphoglycerate dehydrogenase [Candidatus Omnitrophota bacterium]MDE2231907.1 phosphoglycerate dehydrogenase [Candidatus Omnitrophota bacterium]